MARHAAHDEDAEAGLQAQQQQQACPRCAPLHVELEMDEAEGFLLCPQCGFVADELQLVHGVQWDKEGAALGTRVAFHDDPGGAAGELTSPPLRTSRWKEPTVAHCSEAAEVTAAHAHAGLVVAPLHACRGRRGRAGDRVARAPAEPQRGGSAAAAAAPARPAGPRAHRRRRAGAGRAPRAGGG